MKKIFIFIFLGIIFTGTASADTCTYVAEVNTWSYCAGAGLSNAVYPVIYGTATVGDPACEGVPLVRPCEVCNDIDDDDNGLIDYQYSDSYMVSGTSTLTGINGDGLARIIATPDTPASIDGADWIWDESDNNSTTSSAVFIHKYYSEVEATSSVSLLSRHRGVLRLYTNDGTGDLLRYSGSPVNLTLPAVHFNVGFNTFKFVITGEPWSSTVFPLGLTYKINLPDIESVCTESFSASCTATPPSAILNTSPTTINWTATSTGGTGSYTYSWDGNDDTGTDSWTAGNISSISRDYTTIGTKYATTTITSGTQSVVLACPGSITDSGTQTGGNGVYISPSYSGVCAVSGEQDYRPSSWCSSGTLGTWSANTDDGPWGWECLGSNPDSTTDVNCQAFLKDIVIDSDLDCNLRMTPFASSTVRINTNTIWTATSTTNKDWTGYTKNWTVNGVIETFANQNSNSLPKIFTTTGVKEVGLTIASSTNSRYRGNMCTSTTEVIQTGQVIER
jgi:hypothetical protein